MLETHPSHPGSRSSPRATWEERAASTRDALRSYLGDVVEDPELRVLRAADLPSPLRAQVLATGNPRLADAIVVAVPTSRWHKGAQPTEFSADGPCIIVRADVLEGDDRIGWISHELGHLGQFLRSPAQHARDAVAPASLSYPLTYPNTLVELEAFQQQFASLRSRGVPDAEVLALLGEHYSGWELDFLREVFDGTLR